MQNPRKIRGEFFDNAHLHTTQKKWCKIAQKKVSEVAFGNNKKALKIERHKL